MKTMWTSGDFGKLAELMEKSAEKISCSAWRSSRECGCSTSVAGRAIRAFLRRGRGRRSRACDIAPNLLAQAVGRAKREGLNIHFREGDAEELPFTDDEFDVVLSMFAAMFAPRPEMVVSEFMRVCRKGGLIAMGNWTLDSFVAGQHVIMSKFVPPPPGSSQSDGLGRRAHCAGALRRSCGGDMYAETDRLRSAVRAKRGRRVLPPLSGAGTNCHEQAG